MRETWYKNVLFFTGLVIWLCLFAERSRRKCMFDVEYYKPASLNEALQVLSNCRRRGINARPLAGGTDLLPLMKGKYLLPDAIVELTDLPELRGIRVAEGVMRIGATTTFAELSDNANLRNLVPCLHMACRQVGSVQIRNRGTIAGNLCTASPAGDSIPPLYVLDAVIELSSMQNGKASVRHIPVGDLFKAPGSTVIELHEVVTAIRFNVPDASCKGWFAKIGQRKAMTISKINIALLFKLKGTIIDDIRIALGSVAPTIVRALRTESFLRGKEINDSCAGTCAEEIIREECSPIDDIRSFAWYRREMSGILLRRGLKALAPGEMS